MYLLSTLWRSHSSSSPPPEPSSSSVSTNHNKASTHTHHIQAVRYQYQDENGNLIMDETTNKKNHELQYDFFRRQWIPKQNQTQIPTNIVSTPTTQLPQHQYDDDDDVALDTRTNFLPHLLKHEMKDDEYDQYLILQQQQEKEERERQEALKRKKSLRSPSLKGLISLVTSSFKLISSGESNKVIPLEPKQSSSSLLSPKSPATQINSPDVTPNVDSKERIKDANYNDEDEALLSRRLDEDSNSIRNRSNYPLSMDDEEMELFKETDTVLQMYKNLHKHREPIKYIHPSNMSGSRRFRPSSGSGKSSKKVSSSLTDGVNQRELN